MELNKGFNTNECDGWAHFLRLLENIYGKKQAGSVCNHNLNNELQSIGFKKSAVDEWVWYKEKTIFFYNVNGGIFMGTDPRAIDKVIEEIENSGFDIEDKGNIENCLWVSIEE